MKDTENDMEDSGKNMNNIQSIHLEELKHSDYQLEDGMEDIDDWDITDYTGLVIGKVQDFLFDTNAKLIRYIITTLEGDDQKVLIPIGKVQLNEEANLVVVQNLTFRQLRGLPTYIKGNLTSDEEYAIQHLFEFYENKKMALENREAFNHNTFYENESFNRDQLFKKMLGDDMEDIM